MPSTMSYLSMAVIGACVFGIGTMMGLSPMIVSVTKWIMIVGMVGIVLTGGREAQSIGGKLAMGVYSLYNITVMSATLSPIPVLWLWVWQVGLSAWLST